MSAINTCGGASLAFFTGTRQDDCLAARLISIGLQFARADKSVRMITSDSDFNRRAGVFGLLILGYCEGDVLRARMMAQGLCSGRTSKDLSLKLGLSKDFLEELRFNFHCTHVTCDDLLSILSTTPDLETVPLAA